ncbi:MAG: cytochrome c-type biogenesis protein CcmH [Solirubrobacteraceae bacterium]
MHARYAAGPPHRARKSDTAAKKRPAERAKAASTLGRSARSRRSRSSTIRGTLCGVPLALADAPPAERERALVTSMLRGCRSKDEIESALVAQYGPRVLALPKASGFRPVAYLVPGLAAAAVAVGLAVAATRWRRHPRAVPGELVTDRSPLEPLHAARIDAELECYRR